MPLGHKKALLELFNSIWIKKIPFPPMWKEYIVVPIKKLGKQNGNADSYRPIALSSCIFKTMERMIKNRIHTQIHLATFLDITSAYDNVQINILEEKLINIGLPTSFANFIKSAYSSRSVSLKINKEVSESRICRSGLPQGSILSPILYSLYTMDIENVISRKSKIIQYADDVVIYTSNKSEDKCIENINTEFIEIQKCLDNMEVSISESKTNICIFSRNRNNYQRPLTIGKYKLRISNSVKYLGLHLDRKLLWKDCIHQIIKKTSNSINILRAFWRGKWGADPNTALLFYKTMVRSIMDYGSQLYGTAADTHLNKIEIQQNKCLRVCLGYLKSTPINIMQAEAVEPPLKLRRQLLSRKFVIKTISKKTSYLNSIQSLTVQVLTHRYWHFKKTPLIVETFSEILDITDILYSNQLPPVLIYSPEQIFSREIRTYYFESQEVASFNQTKFNETKNKYWPNYDSIFTDGSKSKEYTSCAFYHVEENTDKKFILPKEASIYTAELTAIVQAMKYILGSNHDKFIICTDSKSAVDKLKKVNINRSVNHIEANILYLHNETHIKNKVVIYLWVKGHAGTTGNEIVDTLAKTAPTSGEELNLKLPPSDLFLNQRNKINEMWQNLHNASTTGTNFCKHQQRIPRKPWFHKIPNRYFVATINRVRANQALTPYYKHKMKITDDPLCSCGCQCVMTDDRRQEDMKLE
ncbi:uncharacterized protein [Diabrotica undecimpunctata]|uniref:uncharacterized protein n=1 Tax=Diabrotica undecimpunctata TaxID=50387 RepID=UPI003B63CE2D